MPKPSLFSQVEATPIATTLLKESPRHWNCGLFNYRGKLWLSYRYHLKEHGGRCATAMCPIDDQTLQPIGRSQWIKLSGPTGSEHHEDARLFFFRDEPYISYTEMRGYRPGVDYTCVIKYSKLKLVGRQWLVEKTWQPDYGQNAGHAKEKNWVFFENDGKLHCLYESTPNTIVFEVKGDRAVKVHETQGPNWPWGVVRGGSPPIQYGTDSYITFFHSSLATEEPPHFVRYYAGAMVFDNKPPFRVTAISKKPILSGSEEDGHRVDPRYVEGWKPYVVFPCGCVPMGGINGDASWLVSLGVNDWQCAIAKVKSHDLVLGRPDNSDFRPRFFRTPNGSVPAPVMDGELHKPRFIDWIIPQTGFTVGVREGFMKLDNPRDAQEVSELPSVSEISESDYNRSVSRMAGFR